MMNIFSVQKSYGYSNLSKNTKSNKNEIIFGIISLSFKWVCRRFLIQFPVAVHELQPPQGIFATPLVKNATPYRILMQSPRLSRFSCAWHRRRCEGTVFRWATIEQPGSSFYPALARNLTSSLPRANIFVSAKRG